MIRYADDFILMAKHINQETLVRLNGYLTRMGLILNTEKSKLVQAREESFDFLGFTFRYDRSIFKNGTKFWNIMPKAKSRKKIRQKVNEMLKKRGHFNAQMLVYELNPVLRGWMNYYRIEKVSYTQLAFRELDQYIRYRLNRYYNRKSQRKSRLFGKQAFEILVRDYGLVRPYRTSGIRPVNALR